MQSKFDSINYTVINNGVIDAIVCEVLNLAKQVEETLNFVLDSAKKEFLEKGFERASLRTISQNAGVTTGALYVRFSSKDALFASLVSPIAEALLAFYREGDQVASDLLVEDKPQDMWGFSSEMIGELVEFIYANRDAFLLLLDRAAGSSYENFLDDLVEEALRQTNTFIEGQQSNGHTVQDASQQDLHVLMTAQFYALFEVIRHDTHKTQAVKRIQTVVDFFRPGWEKILGI